MTDRIQDFVALSRENGLLDGVLAAAAYVTPSPFEYHIRFARDILHETTPQTTRRSCLSMYRNGLKPKSYHLYDLETHGIDDYISDFDERSCWEINKPHEPYLNDKLRFYEVLDDNGFGDYLPTLHGTISGGRFEGEGDDLTTLVQREGTLVIKERKGAEGDGVFICEGADDGIRLNGDSITGPEFRSRIAEFDEMLVTEYCEQDQYIASVFPETPNTVRILTMNPSDGDPFVARPVHRIGAENSGAVDNFSQGGLSAKINRDGTLTEAVRYEDGHVSWHDTHPDTGARIEGVEVPRWSEIRETLLSIVRAVPEFKYVGWDVIVTNEGFKIIEGNTNTDTDLLQAHGPLLTDDRVREFYQENGIIS